MSLQKSTKSIEELVISWDGWVEVKIKIFQSFKDVVGPRG